MPHSSRGSRFRWTGCLAWGALAFTLAFGLTLTIDVRRTAHACSCAFKLERKVLPADGTSGFPSNGQLRIFFDGPFLEQVRKAAPAEYRLKDARGRAILLRTRWVLNRLDLIPRSPLRPKTRYRLEQRFWYSPGGKLQQQMRRSFYRSDKKLWLHKRLGLVSDWGRHMLLLAEKRKAASRGKKTPVSYKPQWRWHVVNSFVTGPKPSQRSPGAPEGFIVRYNFRYGGGDCGPGTSVHVEFSPASGERFVTYELFQRGRGRIAALSLEQARRLCRPGERPSYPNGCGWKPRKRIPGLKRYAFSVGDMHCYAPKVRFRRDGRYELRLVAISAAGKTSVSSTGAVWTRASNWADSRSPAARKKAHAPGKPGGSVRTNGMLVDKDKLWIASSEGLYLKDARTGRARRHYTTKHGLPDLAALAVLRGRGRAAPLWVITRSGPATLKGNRFVAIQGAAAPDPRSAHQRAWRRNLQFEKRMNRTPDPPATGEQWRRLLEGATRLMAAVGPGGDLFLCAGSFPGLLLRCTARDCRGYPDHLGGPTGRRLSSLASGPDQAVWVRTEEYWIVDRPRGRHRPTAIAEPKGPPGYFRSRLKGVLRLRRKRFREVPLPEIGGYYRPFDLLPVSASRAWVLHHAHGKQPKVALYDFTRRRYLQQQILTTTFAPHRRRSPHYWLWSGDARTLWIKIGDKLWLLDATGKRMLSMEGKHGLPPADLVTAMSYSTRDKALWLASDSHVLSYRAGTVTRRFTWPRRPLDLTAEAQIELIVPKPFPGAVRLVRRRDRVEVSWEEARDPEGKQPPRTGRGRLGLDRYRKLISALDRDGAFGLQSPPFYFRYKDLFFEVKIQVGTRRNQFRIFALGEHEDPAYGRIYRQLMVLRRQLEPLPAGAAKLALKWKRRPPARTHATIEEKVRRLKPRPELRKKKAKEKKETEPPLKLAPTPPPAAVPVNLFAAPEVSCAGTKVIQTPKHRWIFRAPSPGMYARVLATPKAVYHTSGHRFVYALDPRSGRVRWRYDLYDATTQGMPVLTGGTLLVPASGHRWLFALDARTGKLRWAQAHPSRKTEHQRYQIFHPPRVLAVGRQVWLIGREAIDVVDPKSGRKLRSIPGRFGHQHALRSSSGSVLLVQYHAKSSSLVELTRTGEKVLRRWSLKNGSIRERALAYSGLLSTKNNVVWAAESYPRVRTHLNVISGTGRGTPRRWSVLTPGEGRWAHSIAATRAGTIALVAREERRVQLLALRLPKRPLWRRAARNAGPVYAHGKWLYWHAENHILQIDPSTGCARRRLGTGAYEPYSLNYAKPAQVVGDSLYTVAQNGTVVAFSIK